MTLRAGHGRSRRRAAAGACAVVATWAALAALPGCVPRSTIPAAVWVVRDRIETPEGSGRICRAVTSAGLHTVVLQIRGRGDAYYASSLAPRAEALAGRTADFDPLGEVLHQCADTRVLAWMNVFFVWGGETAPLDPGHVANAHPEWGIRDGDGRAVAEYSAAERALGWIEGLYVDPASPEYREHFARLVREVVTRYPVAGIHLDFVRYPGAGYGQGASLGRDFADVWGIDPRWIPEPLRTPDLERYWSGEGTAADRVLATAALLWADLRAHQVTTLVRRVRQTLDEVRPGLELSAAVFPDAGPAFLEKGQDWRTWVAQSSVDAIFPMAYFGGAERVESQLRSVAALTRAASPTVGLWAGLGAYLKEPSAIAAEAAIASRLGYDGVCLFDAGTLLDQPAGIQGYTGRFRGQRGIAAAAPVRAAPGRAETPGGRQLAAVLDRATAGTLPTGADAGARLDRLWAEFEHAAGGVFSRAAAAVTAEGGRQVEWVDLQGVFRYLHPDDGGQRREEQLAVIAEARARLVDGDDPAAVAAALSQGGTRNHGGVLARRYLRPGSPEDAVFAPLAPGDVSPVVTASNGFWVYRVLDRGTVPRGAKDLPWQLRRARFRDALTHLLEGHEAPSRAAGPARSGAPG